MNHAEKHGRVLPDDGRSYIAESVLLLHATFKEFHNIEYGPRELNDIYRATEQSLFDRLDKQS